MKPSAKKSTTNLLDIEQNIYDLKVYAKDMFLHIIEKLDKLESQVNKIKLENNKKGTKSVENNVSLLGDFIEKGTATNRKYKSDENIGNESHVKKKKLRTKNDTQIINEKLKKIIEENEDSDDIKIINKDDISENNKSIRDVKEKKSKKENKKSDESIKLENVNQESEKKSKKEKQKKDESRKVNQESEKTVKKEKQKSESKKEIENVNEESEKNIKKSNKGTKKENVEDLNVNTPKKSKDLVLTTDTTKLITTEFSYKGNYTNRTYDLLKMKERFFRYFKDNWFTVPSSCKLFFNSKQRPPMDEWIAALDCMYEKKMIDRNEGEKLKYKVIE